MRGWASRTRNWCSGKKTLFAGLSLIISGIGMILAEDRVTEGIVTILNGFGFIFMRQAIAKTHREGM